MPTALVVGGTGFVGRAIVAAIRELDTPSDGGLEVVVLSRRSDGSGRPAVALDLESRDALQEVGQVLRALRPSVVVNAAGAIEGSAAALAASNVLVTARLLDALEADDRPVRYLHLGSAAEYGPGPRDVPVAEHVPGRPVSAYGVTKLAATELVLLARASGLDAMVLRPFNVVGRAMPASTLPGAAARRLVAAIAAGDRRVEFGHLDAVRDFVDVDDIGRAVALAAVAPVLPGPIVNVGSGEGHTARELVTTMAAVLGFDGEITETDAASPRSGGVDWQVADVRLARTSLSWAPRASFEAAVRRAAIDLWAQPAAQGKPSP